MRNLLVSILTSLAPYKPLLMPFVVWPLISAAINFAFYKRTPAQWEAWALKRPVLAFFVELCRVNGWDITKNLKLMQRLAARRAGQLPVDGWDRLPLSPELKEGLQDPATRATLETLFTSLPQAPSRRTPVNYLMASETPPSAD